MTSCIENSTSIKKEWSKVLYYKSKGGISKWKREM